jgi:hypothetical protein
LLKVSSRWPCSRSFICLVSAVKSHISSCDLIRWSTQRDSQASYWRDEEISLATAGKDWVVVAAVCPLRVVHWD